MSILSKFNILGNTTANPWQYTTVLRKETKRACLLCHKPIYTLFSIALAVKEHNLDLVLIYKYLTPVICNFTNIIIADYITVVPLLLSWRILSQFEQQ